MTGVVEINFDGIIGPSHNYGGLSIGNVASQGNAGQVSHPRAAALQGIGKMRAALELGLVQGIFVPPPRPNIAWLASLGLDDVGAAPRHLQAAAISASAMWAANAATVSPAADTRDGRCHLTVANLLTMPHRGHEAEWTYRQLRVAFADPAFVVHPPVPAPFGDEGAANHMRLARTHANPGVEVFVHGTSGTAYPARQHAEASRAVARLNQVERSLFVGQSPEAIAAGAFHNDVVAVANEHVLFAHAQAFVDRDRLYADLIAELPEVAIVEVPAAVLSLDDAIATYLFNAQLVTLPSQAGMALIVPSQVRGHAAAWRWLEALIAEAGPIRRLVPVEVGESLANGGGPACLRLRVVCEPVRVDARFLVDASKLDRIEAVIGRFWPAEIVADDLTNVGLVHDIGRARDALVEELALPELSG